MSIIIRVSAIILLLLLVLGEVVHSVTEKHHSAACLRSLYSTSTLVNYKSSGTLKNVCKMLLLRVKQPIYKNRLRHLSTELVGLRNRLHGSQAVSSPNQLPPAPMQHHDQPENLTSPQPQYSPPVTSTTNEFLPNVAPPGPPSTATALAASTHIPYPFGLPHSNSTDGLSTLRSVRNNRNGMTNTGSVSNAPSTAPANNSIHHQNNHPNGVRPPMQSPKPVSTNLPHHNYSNIQHPQPSLPNQQQQGNSPPPPPHKNISNNNIGTANNESSSSAVRRRAVRPRSPSLVQFTVDAEKLSRIEDLIRLPCTVNEDTILKALQARFQNRSYFTNVGPIVLSVNPYTEVGNPLTLDSTKNQAANSKYLQKVVKETVRLQSETGYPQALIVSGGSGSGKSYTSMILLRQLFEQANGSQETDTFKHLAASFSVLRSLGMAKTASNRESSRIGHFIEVQVSDGALYRTKIHCYFLDQSRLVLSQDERRSLGLDGLTIRDLNFLNSGDYRQDEAQDAERFEEWKVNLGILGIPFMDVVRVLASILLLGNIDFLLKERVRGQLVKSMSDINMAAATRNALAKALYCRTVATIVRRANSLKRPVGAMSGTMSSDSNESVQHDVASHQASTVGTAGSRKSSKSMAILNHAVRHATDGFIGILDMFGFEDSKPSRLEHLCINLCSETMQHFYNTHIFKSSIESCRDEGIITDLVVDYVDNVPCIDLISSLRTGLLSMLDVECSVRGCPETYVQKVKIQHKDNKKLFEPKHCDISRTFAIHHYAGQVVYDTSYFLDTNRDVIPDDLLCVFDRDTCQFGFATHLFGNEIKALRSQDTIPRGVSFRISPTSSSTSPELLNGDEPVSTLTQDFHTRLDNLLRTLVHAKPHFVRCIKPNNKESSTEFDRTLVAQQIRSLQILETVNLMSGGFPHRMRFKAFNTRYRCLADHSRMLSRRVEEKAVEDCEIILDCYQRLRRADAELLDSTDRKHHDLNKTQRNGEWAHGRKHVFLSERARQKLEELRNLKRNMCATKLQALYRGYISRKIRGSMIKKVMTIKSAEELPLRNGGRPRPAPIAGTPPPDMSGFSSALPSAPPGQNTFSRHISDRCDFQTIQQTCALFGLDLERPPPVPPSRSYTIAGTKKVNFPQTRVMKSSFPDDGDILIKKGESVIVIGVSTRRSHLIVEKKNHTLHVPHRFLEFKAA
ncbi:DACHS [Lepeophtheirus salmonis]|uniref:DACHS n=1 Tax=Lepeophtheirus salmonis TaxID=72036 RepID=A0A7R8CBP6_LEPSM|nr:DACHS [Lepeophtheirus salmonis]CAF2762678.1 DACHS [Lepeophtheirus salmonis]